ncbi:HNH endonuclease [Nocardioides flavus (ex Wang et al. 2016)]|uniref:HNH endonuclease n=1 Tax=Nocardioides flavus (ex Wang et al. 2016) TaxID=2058780 RepID=A0ABQ3HNZ7_9ACTN|nr:HNH endonuclease signature motif containing protein [Nocardioides flavus (ex Wang et al. 2016)]GHE19408.1 HNH endonuclease [Nocardioides flavus (ex Wang et al. 2016)]
MAEAVGQEWQASDLHALADLLADLTPGTLGPDLLDQLEALERIKSAAAAAQAVVAATFADVADSEDAPVDGRRTPPRAMSIGAEVALATLASPYAGEQRVLLSHRLRDDLPLTLAALGRGELTEARALAIARGVDHLTPEQRGRVDEDLAPRLAGLGDVRLRDAVRRSCLTHAADAEARRCRRARADRRVTSRALDDGTGRLTAILPLEALVCVRGVLDAEAAAARAAGDSRTAGQARADILAARITGRDPASDPPPVKVNLVIGVESLLGDGTEPGQILGAGHLPAALCTDLVRRASAAAKAIIRRLFVTPADRALIAMESTTRRFDGLLAEFLDLRDGGLCRTPGCNAAIRHHDHITPVADDGPTAASNGQGLCERCNYVKESPGWTSWVADPGDTGLHEVHGVTEHLRLVRSTAPPAPGGDGCLVDYSPFELRLASTFTLIS